MADPVSHFIQSWIFWVITLNFALTFIIRPKFIFSPRRRIKMARENSRLMIVAFCFALFFSALLVGSATYFLRINNQYILMPEDH